MKNYLKSNRYPTTKQFLNLSISSMDTESSLDLPYLVTVLLSPCRLVQKNKQDVYADIFNLEILQEDWVLQCFLLLLLLLWGQMAAGINMGS